MPELWVHLLNDLVKEIKDINKSLTGIRADLEEIEQSIRRDH